MHLSVFRNGKNLINSCYLLKQKHLKNIYYISNMNLNVSTTPTLKNSTKFSLYNYLFEFNKNVKSISQTYSANIYDLILEFWFLKKLHKKLCFPNKIVFLKTNAFFEKATCIDVVTGCLSSFFFTKTSVQKKKFFLKPIFSQGQFRVLIWNLKHLRIRRRKFRNFKFFKKAKLKKSRLIFHRSSFSYPTLFFNKSRIKLTLKKWWIWLSRRRYYWRMNRWYLKFIITKRYMRFIRSKRQQRRLRFKRKRFECWRSKKRSASYSLKLKTFRDLIRINSDKVLFTSLKKKKFLLLNNVVTTSKICYNLNLIPFTALTSPQKFLILKTFNVFKNQFFPKLLGFFSSQFFEKLTNSKVMLKLKSNTTATKFESALITYFVKKFFFFQKQYKGVLYLNELIRILILTFKHKDLFFLKNWLINFLEKINLKKHKAFLRGFKRIILFFLNSFATTFKVSGFLFDIRGKVGVAGNAKKRHFSIKYKCYGYTRVKLKADQLKFLVRTNTGVLGLTTIITY